MPTRRYPRIVFFDVEGTIFQKEHRLDNGKVAPSVWTVLAAALGDECYLEEERTKDKWNNNEYNGYVEWMRETVDIHKKFGLTEYTFRAIINSIQYYNNAMRVFAELRANKVITSTITGGFKALSDRSQRDLKVDHAFSACEYFFDIKTGQIEHANLLPADELGKVGFMEVVAQEHGVKLQDCAFVGDGKNDVSAAMAVGLSVCFNGQSEMRTACTSIIDQDRGHEDFGAVLKELQLMR